MLMKLGALRDDKTEAGVPDLPVERWRYDKNPELACAAIHL